MVFLLIVLCGWCLGPAGTVYADDLGTPLQPPRILSRSGILLDAETGTVLFEKEADLPIPPASLTKLMTMHLVLQAVAAGRASLDDIVALPPAAWAINQSPGSSLMFLAPGQIVSLREILLGLAVASGNDAAVAAALHVAGGVSAFTAGMNAEARRLGLSRTRFAEPGGISEFNTTTARDFAFFARQYVLMHPDTLRDYHSVREFSYPQPHNLPPAFQDQPRTVFQYNRNLLLDSVAGVDGLKTGYIIESGYNIALTAQRDDTRLIAVLLGGPGSGSAQGGRFREQDGGALLDWGFTHYRTLRPVVAHLDPVLVYKGKRSDLDLVLSEAPAFTLRTDRGTGFGWRLELQEPFVAPIQKGDVLGQLVFFDTRGELRRVALQASGSVAPGGFFKRMFDSIRLLFRSLTWRAQ